MTCPLSLGLKVDLGGAFMLFNSTVMCLRHVGGEWFRTTYITGWRLLVSERECCPEPLVCTKSGRKVGWMDKSRT